MYRSINTLKYLYVLLSKRSKAFTCCAGCNNLAVLPDRRLCVSLAFDQPIDLVLTVGWDALNAKAALSFLRRAMPWLRRIFIPSTACEFVDIDKKISALPAGIEEDSLHLAHDLAEHFITLPHTAQEKLSRSLLPLDFFTPNALPLLFAEPGGTADAPRFAFGPAARTKELTLLFSRKWANKPFPNADYTLDFARWAYAQQKGILSIVPSGSSPKFA
jgi:hypothetical protein